MVYHLPSSWSTTFLTPDFTFRHFTTWHLGFGFCYWCKIASSKVILFFNRSSWPICLHLWLSLPSSTTTYSRKKSTSIERSRFKSCWKNKSKSTNFFLTVCSSMTISKNCQEIYFKFRSKRNQRWCQKSSMSTRLSKICSLNTTIMKFWTWSKSFSRKPPSKL